MFQSLIGRLKTNQYSGYSLLLCHSFQSLIGRLKTAVNIASSVSISRFQSLIGRLKTLYGDIMERRRVYVSIPYR